MAKYATYNFELYQGADEIYPVAFYNTDKNSKTPMEFTDACEYKMTVEDAAGVFYDELSYSNGRIKLGVVEDSEFIETIEGANALLLLFPHEVTEKFTLPALVYDLFQIMPDDTRNILLHGKIVMRKSVTYD